MTPLAELHARILSAAQGDSLVEYRHARDQVRRMRTRLDLLPEDPAAGARAEAREVLVAAIAAESRCREKANGITQLIALMPQLFEAGSITTHLTFRK